MLYCSQKAKKRWCEANLNWRKGVSVWANWALSTMWPRCVRGTVLFAAWVLRAIPNAAGTNWRGSKSWRLSPCLPSWGAPVTTWESTYPEARFSLMPGHKKHTDVCRCVRHSIGILPNGNVVACFWALDSNTGTVEDKYLLGNVRQNSLLEILNGEKAHYWSDCEHCCELGSGDAPEGGMHRDVLSA